jgi:hypothetical protein
MCNTQNVKISKEMGFNYQLYFWHIFITWVVVAGREIQRKNHTKEICEKMHHYCQIWSNSSCG